MLPFTRPVTAATLAVTWSEASDSVFDSRNFETVVCSASPSSRAEVAPNYGATRMIMPLR